MPNFQEYYLSYETGGNRAEMMQRLKQVLDDITGPVDIFSDSTYSDSSSDDINIILYDDNNNAIFEIHDIGGAGNTADDWSRYKIIMHSDAGEAKTVTLTSTSDTSDSKNIIGWRLGFGYSCQYGVIFNALPVYKGLTIQSVPLMWCLITQSFSGKPFMVVCGYTGAATTSGTTIGNRQEQAVSVMGIEHTVCTTDALPLLSIAKGAPADRNQSVLVPLFSNSQVNEVSYSPYAARFYAGNMDAFLYDSQIHVIRFNESLYMSNGYWTLQL